MQQPQQTIPHIVQVYQPPVPTTKIQNPQIIHISHPSLQTSQGKVTYQQTITSKTLHIPVTHVPEIHMSQNQIIMSCQQTHLQNMQTLQTSQGPQVIQSSDMSQPVHVILPQVPSILKQHLLLGGVQQQYYGQFENYQEEQCSVTKLDPDVQLQMLPAKPEE